MISPTDLTEVLEEHLPAHLRRQRWAGALDRPIARAELLWQEVVQADDPMLVWAMTRAHFEDGATQDYQLFVGVRPAAPTPDFLHGKERELIAMVPSSPEGAVVYDALVDPDLAIAVLHLVQPDLHVEVRRPLVLEHSNSSIVFDEANILKIFRKVEPGPNPDVEITRVLADRGYEHVLAPLAELRRDDTDLAVLREFLVGSTEGWELARASVRDMLASDLAPSECGADFAPDAMRLGDMLAGLHLAMGDAWGAASGDTARWAAEMGANLDQVLATAGDRPIGFDVDAVRAHFAEVASLDDAGTDIRIHGDLHLAQVIKSDAGWKVLDFEGEPARRRDDRFSVSSPLRDVAGLLRSLHYAAASGLAEWSDEEPNPDHVELVAQWEHRNREALRGCYYGHDGIDALLPAEGGRDAVLSAFELDKAVYEVGYELGHRPEHVDIPLAGVSRLLTAKAGT